MVERKLPAKGSAGSFVCYFRRTSTVISGGCFKHQVGLDDVRLCLSYLLFVLLPLLATSLNLHKTKSAAVIAILQTERNLIPKP